MIHTFKCIFLNKSYLPRWLTQTAELEMAKSNQFDGPGCICCKIWVDKRMHSLYVELDLEVCFIEGNFFMMY